jgi:hypothetical protein
VQCAAPGWRRREPFLLKRQPYLKDFMVADLRVLIHHRACCVLLGLPPSCMRNGANHPALAGETSR